MVSETVSHETKCSEKLHLNVKLALMIHTIYLSGQNDFPFYLEPAFWVFFSPVGLLGVFIIKNLKGHYT